MIQVRGLQEILARLRGADAPGTMAAMLETQAGLLADAVRESLGTPPGGDHSRPWEQTGALQASIGHQAAGLEAVVGSNDPAAAPQESGTVHLVPRPFLQPVAAAKGREAADAVGLAVARRLRGEETADIVRVGALDASGGAIGGGIALGLGYLMWRAQRNSDQMTSRRAEPLTREPTLTPAPGVAVESRHDQDDDQDAKPPRPKQAGDRSGRSGPPTDPKDPEGVPPAGGMRRLSEAELKAVAKKDGYNRVEKWKTDELDLNGTSDIVSDVNGELYAIPRQGAGPPQRLYRNLHE